MPCWTVLVSTTAKVRRIPLILLDLPICYDAFSRAGKTDIAVPVFDRTLELSRAAARLIPGTARHILVEGNYLLLDQPGWRELADFFCNNGNDHRSKAVVGKPTDAKMAKLEPSTGKEKMRK